MWVVWWSWLAPIPLGCQALPCAEASGCWLAGPGHEAADCRTPGGLGANAGSQVGRVRVQKTPGLLSTHWWVKPGSGVSAGLLAHRAGSWSLATGPRDPTACVRSLVGRGWFLTQLGTVSRMSQSLCLPANGQEQGPAGPRAGSGLL